MRDEGVCVCVCACMHSSFIAKPCTHAHAHARTRARTHTHTHAHTHRHTHTHHSQNTTAARSTWWRFSRGLPAHGRGGRRGDEKLLGWLRDLKITHFGRPDIKRLSKPQAASRKPRCCDVHARMQWYGQQAIAQGRHGHCRVSTCDMRAL